MVILLTPPLAPPPAWVNVRPWLEGRGERSRNWGFAGTHVPAKPQFRRFWLGR